MRLSCVQILSHPWITNTPYLPEKRPRTPIEGEDDGNDTEPEVDLEGEGEIKTQGDIKVLL
jgi:hypothetical protein